MDSVTGWILRGIGVVLIICSFTIVSYGIQHGWFVRQEPTDLYCFFDTPSVNDSVPRNMCGYVHILSPRKVSLGTLNLQKSGIRLVCAESLDMLATCNDKGLLRYAAYNLSVFCSTFPCDMTGRVCGAYYMTYLSNVSHSVYEATMFQVNATSEGELRLLLEGCYDG